MGLCLSRALQTFSEVLLGGFMFCFLYKGFESVLQMHILSGA